MKKKMLIMPAIMVFMTFVLSGCQPLMVLNPKGPNAKTLSDTIIFSIIVMAFILLVVYVLLFIMLTKYRASKQPKDYEPPHEEGSKVLEITWTTIPIIIVTVLAIVTIFTSNKVESQQTTGYEDKDPLVIYASSSNWKWHFSYPEQGIETVNYVNIPTDRPIEFRLYSFGPITSFWIPQLAGQKYAMSNMVTKVHLAADQEGSYMGRNSNFSGEGFAQMEFETEAMKQSDFDQWVKDVKSKEPKLTKKTFDKLLNTSFVGRKSFSSTHLTFSPAPEMYMGNKKMNDMEGMEDVCRPTK